MKKLWPNKKSHQLWFLGALMLPLTACGGLTPTPYEDGYRMSLSSLGYEIDKDGLITVPSVRANLTATAGAPDVREIVYTAILLNSTGKRAVANNSPVVPANGSLHVGARGGYRCLNDTANDPITEGKCLVNRPDAIWVNNGAWGTNTVIRFITPVEWAIAHSNQNKGLSDDTAQWYAEFTFTAQMTTNQSVSWKQRYQFVAPAKTAQ